MGVHSALAPTDTPTQATPTWQSSNGTSSPLPKSRRQIGQVFRYAIATHRADRDPTADLIRPVRRVTVDDDEHGPIGVVHQPLQEGDEHAGVDRANVDFEAHRAARIDGREYVDPQAPADVAQHWRLASRCPGRPSVVVRAQAGQVGEVAPLSLPGSTSPGTESTRTATPLIPLRPWAGALPWRPPRGLTPRPSSPLEDNLRVHPRCTSQGPLLRR